MARSASLGRRARAAAAPPRRNRRSALLPLALPLLGALALLAAADAQAQAPPTPTGLTLTAGDGQFTARWNASPGAGTYVIRYAPQGGAWAAVFARPGTATSKTIVSSSAITISNGTTYWARIRACAGTSTGGANCSALSAAATVTPRAAPADPPPAATPTVSISASPNPVAEGARVTLKVTLSEALAKDVTIPVTTTRGTAERGDVPVPNYFMLIPSGETAAATTIQTAQDDDEDDETFILALAVGELPAGVSAGTASSVTVTIADDDAPDPPPAATPTVSISALPNPVAEGARVTLKVTLSAALAKDVTIPVTTTRGTAERGDVPVPNYFMLIPSGETAAATTIQTAQDDDTDHETFILALAAGELPAGVSAGTASSVTVTIADDDAPDPPPARPQLSFASASYSVHEGESVTLTVNIAPRLASASDVVLNAIFTTVVGDARTPGDYTLSGVTGSGGLWNLTLPANASSAAFTLSAVADGTAEGNEAVTFRLARETADAPYDVAAGAAGRATVTIADPRPPAVPAVRLSASPATVAEGSPVTVTATLSAALAEDVSIPVALTGGTAEPGDFGALASIRIPAGSASGAGTVTTAHDADDEDETFTVALGSLPPSVSAGTPSSVTVTIADGGATGDGDDADDEAPAAPTVSISASPNPVAEGSAVTVRVTLTAALAADVTIPVGLFAVTAEPGDFGALASIRIPAGSTVGAAEVATARDGDADDETFTVEMALESLPREVRAHARHWVVVTIADSAAREPGGGEPPGGGTDPGGIDPPDTGASATPVVGRRARAIAAPYCFVPGAGELDALGESTHLAYRLDGGKDFDLCLWDADENWRDAPAYASCRGGGGAFPRHSTPEAGGEPAGGAAPAGPGGGPSGEKTLSAERAAGLMACVVPTGGEGGDWLLRVAPENIAPENPE